MGLITTHEAAGLPPAWCLAEGCRLCSVAGSWRLSTARRHPQALTGDLTASPAQQPPFSTCAFICGPCLAPLPAAEAQLYGGQWQL